MKNDIEKNIVRHSYCAFSLNEEERINSSSGGIFSLLAKQVLKENGVVYGVAMNTDCSGAGFFRAEDEDGLKYIRGSKYIQAYIGDTYKIIKEDLDNGRKVLFSGVGCQILGLKAFLGQEYINLYTVDLICHGTPSPKVWRAYKKYMEVLHDSGLIKVNFRNKKDGWRNFGITESFGREKHYFQNRYYDPYMSMFLNNLSLRPSCYECTAKIKKESDITLGDFWGIEDVVPELDDGKGSSVVLVRTEKGKKCLVQLLIRLFIRKFYMKRRLHIILRNINRLRNRLNAKFFLKTLIGLSLKIW